MYIDRLKRGAGGILSRDEGTSGLKKGSVPFKNDLETTLVNNQASNIIRTSIAYTYV